MKSFLRALIAVSLLGTISVVADEPQPASASTATTDASGAASPVSEGKPSELDKGASGGGEAKSARPNMPPCSKMPSRLVG